MGTLAGNWRGRVFQLYMHLSLVCIRQALVSSRGTRGQACAWLWALRVIWDARQPFLLSGLPLAVLFVAVEIFLT